MKGCGGEEDGRAWKAINGMPGDGQTGQGTAERKPAVAEEAWPGLSETVGTTEDGRDRSGTSGHGRRYRKRPAMAGDGGDGRTGRGLSA